MTKVLAIIPARGGSKSIPRKNIKLLNGHPLIAYSIAAALQAKSVDRVLVSTDDREIADIARLYGAEVPFLRPPELAGDEVLDLPVFDHALRWLKKTEKIEPEVVVHVRPTSPVRPHSIIDQAVSQLLRDKKADSLRSVAPPAENPFKMWRIDRGRLVPLVPSKLKEPYNMPRQKLPESFWHTGHIDVIRPRTILKKQSMTGERILPLIVERKYVVDIDTLEDWKIAESILRENGLDIIRPSITFPIPPEIKMVVFDFDGVMTDDRVYVTEEGNEAVACSRSDGLGIEKLQKAGIRVAVISKEANPVVGARCRKLGIPFHQGIEQKGSIFKEVVEQENLTMDQVAYVGNDVNDLECMSHARLAVAVADAHPDVLRCAGLVLKKRGGFGAVRELCDLILNMIEQRRAL